MIRSISENHKPVIITQNGEAKAVLQDIQLYEQTRESLAMLKVLAQSNENLGKGKTSLQKESFSRLIKRIEEDKKS